jgi:hypothetical protein
MSHPQRLWKTVWIDAGTLSLRCAIFGHTRGRTRTHNTRLRTALFYPFELRGLVHKIVARTYEDCPSICRQFVPHGPRKSFITRVNHCMKPLSKDKRSPVDRQSKYLVRRIHYPRAGRGDSESGTTKPCIDRPLAHTALNLFDQCKRTAATLKDIRHKSLQRAFKLSVITGGQFKRIHDLSRLCLKRPQ